MAAFLLSAVPCDAATVAGYSSKSAWARFFARLSSRRCSAALWTANLASASGIPKPTIKLMSAAITSRIVSQWPSSPNPPIQLGIHHKALRTPTKAAPPKPTTASGAYTQNARDSLSVSQWRESHLGHAKVASSMWKAANMQAVEITPAKICIASFIFLAPNGAVGMLPCPRWLVRHPQASLLCRRMTRCFSRCQSRSFAVSRLSCSCLPLARAISSLTLLPFQYIAVGTMV